MADLQVSTIYKQTVIAIALTLLLATIIMSVAVGSAEAAGGCRRPETVITALANFTYAKGVANCDYIHSLSRDCICKFATQGDPGLQVTVREFILLATLCKVFPLTLGCQPCAK